MKQKLSVDDGGKLDDSLQRNERATAVKIRLDLYDVRRHRVYNQTCSLYMILYGIGYVHLVIVLDAES